MPTVMPNNKTTPKGQISSSAPPTPPRKKRFFGERPDDIQNKNGLTGPPMQMGPGKNSMFADGRKGQPQGMPPATPNYPSGGPGPSRVSGQPQYMAPATPNYPRMGPGPSSVRGQAQGAMPPTPNYPHMADGRKGQKQGMPPTPNYPHMADGRKGQKQGMPPAGNPRDEMFSNGRMPHMANGRKPMPPRMMADGDLDAPDPMGGEPDADDMQMSQGGQADQGAGPDAPGAGQMPMINPAAVNYHDDPHACSSCQYFSQDGNCQVLQMVVQPQGGCNAFEAGGAGNEVAPPNGGAPDSSIGTSDGGM
jgi:hypothetical protein